ncbi:exonuclease DPD1, chloroplastic/mitochondrial isoform X2 [Lotus japonicus]|uniref:exonuclease DPD1, chloroplastic/mitochondrial isoform X2 n=1 Tax=Lotus japonicus TaxID=34305 RepID=UPI00258A474A|nr:exonuclease DPD1, chloroplastic/mitochondrial isoform X2 [Lotus japonicus]
MKTGSMIFSLLQLPRCRIHSLANYWGETFPSFSNPQNNSSIRLLSSRINGLQEGHRKKWTRRPITTNTEGKGGTKSRSTKHEILSETTLTSSTVSVNKTQLGEFQDIQYCDVKEIAQKKNLSSLVTVIAFDIETTGFGAKNHRIIEIALRDLQGGENSTFQTLVNPQRYVPNSDVHGITNQMVNSPDVPRMEDLIPILLHYVRSREKPGGYVLWVAHNARSFDVPFFINELGRSSVKIPSNWLFLDTLPLGRELMMKLKAESEEKKPPANLAALCEHYNVKLNGAAHRAMVDVDALSVIFSRLTFDLKLTLSDLVEKSFQESDITKKKKNSD